MPTSVSAGESYIRDELIHTIVLDLELAKPWKRDQRDKVRRTVSSVRNVLSCIPREDRRGEITITVSNELSDNDHQAALDGVVDALESIGLHHGKADMRGLRLN